MRNYLLVDIILKVSNGHDSLISLAKTDFVVIANLTYPNYLKTYFCNIRMAKIKHRKKQGFPDFAISALKFFVTMAKSPKKIVI